MTEESPTSGTARWTRAEEVNRLLPGRPIAVKLQGKHIALFLHEGEVLACNNRVGYYFFIFEGILTTTSLLVAASS